MKVILIQGKKSVGKSTLCKEISKYLTETLSAQPEKEEVVEYKQKKDIRDLRGVYHLNGKRIFINSWSDAKKYIKESQHFYTENKNEGYDIFISAIRPKAVNPKIHQWLKDMYVQDIISEEDELVIDLDNTVFNTAKERLEKLFIPLYQNIT